MDPTRPAPPSNTGVLNNGVEGMTEMTPKWPMDLNERSESDLECGSAPAGHCAHTYPCQQVFRIIFKADPPRIPVCSTTVLGDTRNNPEIVLSVRCRRAHPLPPQGGRPTKRFFSRYKKMDSDRRLAAISFPCLRPTSPCLLYTSPSPRD